MTTFTIGAVAYTPAIVDGYSASRASRSIVHPIVGSNDPAIALQPASLRTGSMDCVFTTLALAQAFGNALAQAVLCSLVAPTAPTVAMSFVVIGDIKVTLDSDTRRIGLVTFDYQEIVP